MGIFFQPGQNGREDWGEITSYGVLNRQNDSLKIHQSTGSLLFDGGLGSKKAPSFSSVWVHESAAGLLLDQLTQRVGPMPASLVSVWSLCDELFTLSEDLLQSVDHPVSQIWGHSVRTGYLAALIAEVQTGNPRRVWQSFAGGLLHDIGLLVLLSQKNQFYSKVLELARVRGTDLHEVERRMWGTTHAQVGAALLSRWGFERVVISTVGFHDEPFMISGNSFCPATAVYLANLLDGGGLAQDSDGVLGEEGETYLVRLGLYDRIPYWQARMKEIQQINIV